MKTLPFQFPPSPAPTYSSPTEPAEVAVVVHFCVSVMFPMPWHGDLWSELLCPKPRYCSDLWKTGHDPADGTRTSARVSWKVMYIYSKPPKQDAEKCFKDGVDMYRWCFPRSFPGFQRFDLFGDCYDWVWWPNPSWFMMIIWWFKHTCLVFPLNIKHEGI